MSDNPTSMALAERERPTPAALVKQYEDSFTAVLPSHIAKPETWIRIAQGALKKGKRGQDGRTDLEVAAANNPPAFLAALLDAARLGLEPGTEQYYLTPRKVKGRLEILGMVGYQGEIELAYRAGAISSIVAECVYTADEFAWSPGTLDAEDPPRWAGPQEIPFHRIDWDAEHRGELRLVYAYARMRNGSTSKVVVLNRHDINRIKQYAQNPDGDYSPWKKNPAAMWLKSSIHQLKKWIPTSAEYRLEAADQRQQAEVVAVTMGTELPPEPDDDYREPVPSDHTPADDLDDDDDDDIVEAEIVDDHDEPAPAPRPPAPRPIPDPPASDDAGDDPDQMTEPQRKALHALLRKRGGVGDTRFPILSDLLGREITSTNELSKADASFLIDAMQADEGGAPEGDAA
jgi:recombination protein RecT